MHGSATALATTPEISPGERELDDLRSRALGRLTGYFAHELRNVLTGVRCYLELLSTVELPPEFGGFLGEVQGGLDRMADLAALWHDVARGRCSTAHVNSEVTRLLHMLRAAGVDKQVRMEARLDQQACGVRVDASALEAVLLALLDDLVARRAREILVITSALDGHVRVRLQARDVDDGCAPGVDTARLSELLGDPVSVLEGATLGYELWLGADDSAPASA